ncbi:putative plasmid maintenance system antidote protein, XRE family [Rhodopseudomonas palustris HaA2]|uniref:Putative plasmid maintenance system antidote protein, XRE family n=2 Tax=Rhodopseudomonas palustris TaxID=1076 RepID=Q2IXL2_RHOP2|nr:putative plasmid maintenance system antidote protein, XRE family [Rhodopseudomonas palustris HaA2]
MADRVPLERHRPGRCRDRRLSLARGDDDEEASPCSSRRDSARGVSPADEPVAYAVAAACGVPRTRIERLARQEAPVKADTALRLAKYFGTTPNFWMKLQAQFDLGVAEDNSAEELKRIRPRKAQAA